MAGVNLDELLAMIENKKSSEDIFAEKLAEDNSSKEEEVVASTKKTAKAKKECKEEECEDGMDKEEKCKKAEATEKTASAEDLEKIAESDQQGRIMARAFVDELNKIASYLESEQAHVQPETETEKVANTSVTTDVSAANEIINTLHKLYFQEESNG